MRKYIILSIFFFSFLNPHAQNVKEFNINGNNVTVNSINTFDGYFLYQFQSNWLAKFSNSQGLIFKKYFPLQEITSINYIDQDEQKNIYIIGDSSYLRYKIIKLDNLGNFLWSKTLTTTSEGSGYCSKILIDTTGKIYALLSENRQINIIKLNQGGQLLWSTSFLSDSTGKNPSYDITLNQENEIVGTAKADSYIQLFKLSGSDGSILWNHVLNNGPYSYYAMANSICNFNNSYIFGGYLHYNNINGNYRGILVSKINDLGNIQVSKILNNPGNLNISLSLISLGELSNGEICLIFTTYDGKIVISYLSSSLSLIRSFELQDYTIGQCYRQLNIFNDLFSFPITDQSGVTRIMRLNLTQFPFQCNFVDNYSYSISNFQFNTSYFTHNYFILPDATLNQNNDTIYDLQSMNNYFYCGLNDELLVSTNNLDESSKTNIFPNPVSNQLNINSIFDFKTALIFDYQGKLILECANVTQIDVSGLHPGLYIIQLHSGDKISTQKFIKE